MVNNPLKPYILKDYFAKYGLVFLLSDSVLEFK